MPTSKIVSEVLAANQSYAQNFGKKGELACPSQGLRLPTCMDARLDPAKYAGLTEGDAHIIRNAGGRATDDAIRSLVISHKLLGTKEWFVIHHINCGMKLFSNEIIADLLNDDLATASFDGRNGPTRITRATTPGPFSSKGTRSRIRKRASRRTCGVSAGIRSCLPTCRSAAMSTVKTGRLNEVRMAIEAGQSRSALAASTDYSRASSEPAAISGFTTSVRKVIE